MLGPALGLLLAAASASPVLEHELYKIPAGRVVTVYGERLQAFNFEEYKQLLLVDKQLKEAEAQLKFYADIDKFLKQLDKDRDAMEQLYKVSISAQQMEYTRLFTKWEKTNKDYHKAKAGGIFKHVPLLVGGVLTLVSGISLLVN